MNQNFDICMTMLLAHEGGYSDDSRDSGGKTNLGVTKRVYDEFYGGDATEEVMKALTKHDVIPIYRRNYWDRCRCPDLPNGVDWAVFDLSVNSGTGRAARLLQRAVGAEEDGSIGPLTLMKVKGLDSTSIINRIAVYREEFYRSLSNFDVFGRGWLRRNDETRKQALAML
jgi:lysozyme family protein